MIARPSQGFDAWLTGAPTGLVGSLTVRIEDADTGMVVVTETTAGIIEPRAGFYKTTLVAPALEADYFIVWKNGSTEVTEELVVSTTAPLPTAFAGVSDVAARLGRTFTSDETAQASALLDLVALEIEDAVGQDDAWAAALDPIPPLLKLVSIQATVRAMANPAGAMVTSETLGSHSYTETFPPTQGDSLYLERVDDEAVLEGWLGGQEDPFFFGS